ncbi:4Fe-4S binding protein [Thermodesulfatator indicus]
MKYFYLKKEHNTLSLSEGEDGSNSLLIGAFACEVPDENHLFSPTLRVNASLGDFDRFFLEKIAILEKKRFEENWVKSYTVNKKGKIIVLSKEPEKLTRFEYIYGGLLDLFTLSLGTPSLTHPVAQDIKVSKSKENYLVEFVRRLPIDEEKCTYCGICGPSCPKEAILPDLQVDFTRCDLCLECVKACPEGAIDFNRFESIELKAPYLLFLEETKIELPKDQDGIFFFENFDELLALQGEHEVVELVKQKPKNCQHISYLKTGCSLCLEACPEKAIKEIDDGLQIDHFKCNGCGTCISVCPTGAVVFSPFEDQSFFEYFGELSLKNCRVILAHEEDLKTFWWFRNKEKFPEHIFIEYGEPRALNSAHLLYLWARGASQVYLVAEKKLGIEKELAFANKIAHHFSGKEPFKILLPQEFKTISLEKPPKNPLKEFFSLPEGIKERREVLKEVLAFLISINKEIPIVLEHDSFGEVTAKEGCTLCGACLNVCRIGALSANEEDFALIFTPIKCIACSACLVACPEKVLELTKGLRLEKGFLQTKTLAKSDPARCRNCGKIFGTKKSIEKVKELLKAQGRLKDLEEILELCEDCRAIKMLEKGV